MTTMRFSALALAAGLALGTASGCASGTDPGLARERAIQHSEQRLSQREKELERALSDLAHFRTTREHLGDHYGRRDMKAFDEFMKRFLAERIDPLLENRWQAGHPEIAQLDVDLRLMRVQALMDVRARSAASRSLRDLTRRYRGQEQMLVAHPDGTRETLDESIDSFDRKLNRYKRR